MKKKSIFSIFAMLLLFTVLCFQNFVLSEGVKKKRKMGYQDTPIIPGTKWHVHDGKRPQPPVVIPGKIPSDAIVIFDGKDLSKLKNKNWIVKDGYMEVGRGTQQTLEKFGSVQLHVEWASPTEVKGVGQGRGNSGVFLMGRYEVQILDNYENQTYPDGQAAALYGYKPPLVNACKKPGEWQSYDIFFTAPKFDENKKLVSPAYVTVIHNGILVQNHVELIGASVHKRVGKYSYHPAKDVIKFQDHGNPVRYRNIWVRNLD